MLCDGTGGLTEFHFVLAVRFPDIETKKWASRVKERLLHQRCCGSHITSGRMRIRNCGVPPANIDGIRSSNSFLSILPFCWLLSICSRVYSIGDRKGGCLIGLHTAFDLINGVILGPGGYGIFRFSWFYETYGHGMLASCTDLLMMIGAGFRWSWVLHCIDS